MKRIITVLVVVFVFYFVYAQALECGIAENMGDENLQNVLRRCMTKKTDESQEKSNKSSSESSEESEPQVTAARRGLNSKIRRSIFEIQEGKNLRFRRDTIPSSSTTDEDNHSEQKNDTVSEKCVIQCIFTNLGMADDNGYPNQQRVALGLLKNAKGRELRDFIQDSTDECFQLMQQGEKMEACEYTTHLVTCLSEKGRSNCADWQTTNLPFHN